MAVFYSFHFARDAARVQQVFDMGVVEGQRLLSAPEWEAVTRRGRTAIKSWIDDQMKYKAAAVVLVGAETAGREWVLYEIGKAWTERRPLVGVRIHGLAPDGGVADPPGINPFGQVQLQYGETLADRVPLHTPEGTTPEEIAASIRANLGGWVAGAYKRR